MTLQKKSQDAAARGVATATDTVRVEFIADGSTFVEGLVVSARANVAAPSAAQQLGFVRVIARVGRGSDGASAVAAAATPDAYSGQGSIVVDALVPMVYQGQNPAIIPMGHRMESGDPLTVEITNGLDTTGAVFDADVSVSINRRPSSYGVTG